MARTSDSHTWILLRGLAREKGHWGNFLEKFAAAHPGDEILPIDLPGTGDHLAQNSPTTINGIFNFVRSEAVSRARNQSQFKILAVSLGAMVAMEWMRCKSDDLACCVLINTSSKSLSPFYHRLRWQVWRDFVKLVSVQVARERERGIIEVIMNSPEAREAALPQWTKVATERPMSYKNFFNQLLAASRFEGLTIDPEVPTLILSSLGDRLVDPSCSSQLHDRFNWPIRRHPWAGHDLPWDDPKWVLDRIQEWN
jgi:pimeloyl-ACP methyl ester carboxylesterase